MILLTLTALLLAATVYFMIAIADDGPSRGITLVMALIIEGFVLIGTALIPSGIAEANATVTYEKTTADSMRDNIILKRGCVAGDAPYIMKKMDIADMTVWYPWAKSDMHREYVVVCEK